MIRPDDDTTISVPTRKIFAHHFSHELFLGSVVTDTSSMRPGILKASSEEELILEIVPQNRQLDPLLGMFI